MCNQNKQTKIDKEIDKTIRDFNKCFHEGLKNTSEQIADDMINKMISAYEKYKED